MSNALIFLLFLGAGITFSWVYYEFGKKNMFLLDETFATITPLNLDKTLKIAIIGSGIGGSSAAYFTRKHFESKVEIHMYENTDKVGGRLRVTEVDGRFFEAGGAIIHSSNKYMVRFINELGLKRDSGDNVENEDTLGIYDGKRFVFTDTDGSVSAIIKMVWRYGFFSLYYMKQSLSSMLKSFVNVYKLQDDAKSFNSVPEMLRAIGGDQFYTYTQKTAKEVMMNNGVSELLIDEFVTATTRCNYGQDSSVNAFTGYVSIAGAQGGSLFAVNGGNYQVPQKLVEHSNTTIFLNHHIEYIEKEKKGDRSVYYLFGDSGKKKSIAYDAVIIAAPLEDPKTDLKCDHCNDWPKKSSQHYQKTVATFVQGTLKHKYFNVDKKDLPANILTTEGEKLVSSVGFLADVFGKTDHSPVYKVFTRNELTDDQLNELFVLNSTSAKVETVIPWLAYPHYSVPEKFSSFVLDDAVFYVNAIERAASAMEMSAIGGRNAALLVRNFFGGQKS